MPRQGVSYVQNEEPSFIRQFKQRIGHKDEPDINAKRQIPNFEGDSDEDEQQEKEDEKPVVVVLKPGHLTAEEAASEQTQIDQGPARLDEKIKFKKPTKRTQEASEESEETKKKKEEVHDKKGKKDKKSSKAKPKHNSALLSFNDEEEEEG